MNLIVEFFLFVIAPLFLHEFGHWIFIKYFGLPHKLYFDKREFLVGFLAKGDKRKIQISMLGGAFPPLLIFVPSILLYGKSGILLASFVCIFYICWSFLEVIRYPTRKIKIKGK